MSADEKDIHYHPTEKQVTVRFVPSPKASLSWWNTDIGHTLADIVRLSLLARLHPPVIQFHCI